MNQAIQEAERLYTEPSSPTHIPINPYICSSCKRVAISPVLSACSHLYCWQCIKYLKQTPYKQCDVCGFVIKQQELRTVFVQEDENNNIKQTDGKPTPIYCQPVRNSSGIGAVTPATFIVHNNIEKKKLLGGVSLLPPQLFLVLNSSGQVGVEDSESEKNADRVWNCLRKILFFLLIIAIFQILKP